MNKKGLTSTKGLARAYGLREYSQGFGLFFRSLWQGAKSRGLEFSVDASELHRLSQEPCVYCGVVGGNVFSSCGYRYNGVDRVNSSAGYVSGNLVACCGDCNRAKGALTVEEFRAHVLRIVSHWDGVVEAVEYEAPRNPQVELFQ